MILGRLAAITLMLSLSACSWQESRSPNTAQPGTDQSAVKVVRPNRPASVGRHEPPASSRGRYSMTHDAYPEDGEVPADIMMIPDAIPILEPRSRGGNATQYTVFGETYAVKNSADGYRERGGASWYGKKFHGHLTANGETYDMFAMTGAHKTLPIPSYVRVTHIENGKSVVVRINDRGPFHAGRIIDLSYAAAARLGMIKQGSAQVLVEILLPSTSPSGPTGLAEGTPRPTPTIQASVSATPNHSPTVNAIGMPSGYWQAGAFSVAANASALYETLKGSAFSPVSIHELPRGDQRWHRVMVGPFISQADGEPMRQRLVARGLNPQWVVTR